MSEAINKAGLRELLVGRSSRISGIGYVVFVDCGGEESDVLPQILVGGMILKERIRQVPNHLCELVRTDAEEDFWFVVAGRKEFHRGGKSKMRRRVGLRRKTKSVNGGCFGVETRFHFAKDRVLYGLVDRKQPGERIDDDPVNRLDRGGVTGLVNLSRDETVGRNRTRGKGCCQLSLT